ncbi:MAG: hypothetical protein KHY61_08095, partial [Sutterella wadsworthensis]|nr:hypothetical protein [Sutterella wadsworthensis]
MITATKITYAGPAMSKDMGGAAFCAWVAALTFFALATDQVSPFIAEAFVPVVIVISTVFAVLALGSTVSAVHLTRAGVWKSRRPMVVLAAGAALISLLPALWYFSGLWHVAAGTIAVTGFT